MLSVSPIYGVSLITGQDLGHQYIQRLRPDQDQQLLGGTLSHTYIQCFKAVAYRNL